MILHLVHASDPIIHSVTDKVDFGTLFDFDVFEHNMIDTLVAHEAYGLSANQVGINMQAFALAAGSRGVVIYNPRIVDNSKASQELEEGCLTYPGLILKVTRPRIIKVRYADCRGNFITKTFQDFTARTFLHEFDHLQGITFIDKQVGLKKDFAKKRWAKLSRLNGSGPAKISHRTVDITEIPDYSEIMKKARENSTYTNYYQTSDEEDQTTAM
jgi:peptide deformylase